ncbi:hypothetical protein [Sphingosinicella ginsenosidimutans]|uniref:Uncharacterized protein n=1 Tax=Allosphingosinicella ginsenosidimutans TaxID=1176539 RepID=A0A5C6TV70_9SPHN|nr:hypothetical protein [Sphingosinicella ginsenosidimutans]TXC63785.1 hypothetical protein FRZ32_09000 [Sphingosinicella ginsenosidimutans]
MDEDPDRLRRTLREIEELIAEADRNGGPVDRWLQELADELRSAIPDGAPAPPPAPPPPPPPKVDGAVIARRMRSQPALAAGALSRLDAKALRLLKD